MSFPAVSVVLAVRDGGEPLRRAVQSVLNQTLRDIELILIDDGSATLVSESLAEVDDKKLQIRRIRPSGLTRALNVGLSLARGKYVARQDTDDWSFPDRLARQAEFLDRNTGTSVVGCGVEVVSPSGEPVAKHLYPSKHDELAAFLEQILTPIPHSTMMFRRELVMDLGGYRETFAKAQDYDLLLRVAEVGKLASIPEILCRLTQSRSSMTACELGGEQFRFAVLAYVSHVLRRSGVRDPLSTVAADAFVEEYDSWYRKSRYPKLFRSRLSRRSARLDLCEKRYLKAVTALFSASEADPAWLLEAVCGRRGDISKDARDWVLSRLAREER